MSQTRRDPLVLTFDCGTQSIRALLFDSKGNLLCKCQEYFNPPYISLRPGWAEQDPWTWWEKLCDASQKLKQTVTTDQWKRIAGVSVTTLRDTCVCLDNGLKPVRNSILWLDQRKATCSQPLPAVSEAAFRMVGMREAAQHTRRGAKCNWIREFEPENWDKTAHYIMVSGWLTLMLTDNLVDAIASQIGHVPFDYKAKRWMGKNHIKACITEVESYKLPPLQDTGTVLGTISETASAMTGLTEGLPVIATGSDKGCETLGTGCISDDCASLSFGTTSTVQLSLDRYVEPQQFLPAYPAVMPGMYNPEIEIYRGFWMITWFKQEFASREMDHALSTGIPVEQLLDEQLYRIPPGSDGLMLQPYWGPGLKNPEAKGCIIGFSDYHSRAHLYRAIIEGINYGLIDGLETVERRAHTKISRLTVSGGGAQSDPACQITADMFGLPVQRVQTCETSGLGSALATFVGLGSFPTYQAAVDSMIRYERTFTPSKENHEIYRKLYEQVYKELYAKLQPLYRRLRNIIEHDEESGFIEDGMESETVPIP